MTQQRVTSFARRLNIVLASAGWPPCPILNEPEPHPRTDATVRRFTSLDRETFTLRLMRSDDRAKVVNIKAEWTSRDLVGGLRPEIRIPNDLVRRTRWALA